jgi:cellulose synthase/poly-beta-1,6-N-acetylglucosamine synthase-like glycosyltransferase
MTSGVFVSVIIPNLHSPIIEQTLDSLRQQTYPGEFEIIVVGQDRYEQIREDEQVHFIRTSEPAAPAIARNLGIRAARGEILAFTDADCVAQPDWLERLVAHYADPQVAVVGGGVQFPTDNFWTLCDNLATFYEYLESSPAGKREQLPSLNLSLRKACLDEVGLFDERYPFPAGEDADLTTRLLLAGYDLHFDPEVRVTHLPQRRTPSSIFRHAFNFGRFSVKVDERYQGVLQIPWLLRRAWSTLLFAPVLAGGVVFRMLRNPIIWGRFWYTLPILFAAKIVWCVGAAQTLRAGTPFIESDHSTIRE